MDGTIAMYDFIMARYYVDPKVISPITYVYYTNVIGFTAFSSTRDSVSHAVITSILTFKHTYFSFRFKHLQLLR